MRRGISLIFSFCFILSARSQDMGYKTIDVGAEFQDYYRGNMTCLHLAYNFPIHSGIQFRVGYNKSNWKGAGLHDNEEGQGPVFSLGYRYYTLVRPHGFFFGAHLDFSRLTIDWREGAITGTSKISALQPTIELGYMFLINDMVFITPSVGTGIQTNLKTEGQKVGDGSVFTTGISAGWKF
jgi:hypothetical protein